MKPLTGAWAIAHRGSSGRKPENTIEAFAAAVEDGADAIELDVRLTADGRLAVVHDETLERTHRRPERIASTPARDLARLGVPLLEDVLDAFGGAAALDIEMKTFGKRAVLALARAVRGRVLRPGWFATSFDRPTTEIAAGARLPTGLLYSKPIGDEVDLARHIGARALVARHSAVSPAPVGAPHAARRRARGRASRLGLDDRRRR